MTNIAVPPGFVNVNHMMAIPGDPEEMLWGLGFVITDGETFGPAQAAAFAGLGDIGDWMDQVSNQYELRGWRFEVGQDGDNLNIEQRLGSPINGGTGGGCIPQNTAFLVNKNTALGGRRNRGRAYIPGVPESSADNIGVLTGSARLTLQTNLTSYTGLISSSPSTNLEGPVLFHSESPFTPTPIASLSCNPRVATQRRRLRR